MTSGGKMLLTSQKRSIGVNDQHHSVKVVFLGTCSMGPFFIMNHLNKNGFRSYGVYQGLDEIMLGDEPTTPFAEPISLQELLELDPKIIGISTDSGSFRKAVRIAQRIKNIRPEILIGLGGIHPTVCPDTAIQPEGIDFICTGEGEIAMLELCQAVETGGDYTGVLSMHFKKDGQIIRNPLKPWYGNIDDFSIDRQQLDYSGIFTGLGCKGKCSFCNTPYMMFQMGKGPGMGKYYRKRSVDSVLDEIGTLLKMRWYHNSKKILKSKSLKEVARNFLNLFIVALDPIRFKDDSFLISKDWLREFCQKYRKRFWYLTYYCLGRADEIDEETAELLYQSGCKRVVIGFEHGDEEYRNKILLKRTSDEQIMKCVQSLKKYKIKVNGQWMIGFPGEKVAQAIKTLKMAAQIDDMPQVHIAIPFPKSVMFDMAVQHGWITPDFIPEGGVYSDFVFHKGEEKDLFRLLYNAFPIAQYKIPKGFRVTGLRKKQVWDQKIADILLDKIEVATSTVTVNKENEQNEVVVQELLRPLEAVSIAS